MRRKSCSRRKASGEKGPLDRFSSAMGGPVLCEDISYWARLVNGVEYG